MHLRKQVYDIFVLSASFLQDAAYMSQMFQFRFQLIFDKVMKNKEIDEEEVEPYYTVDTILDSKMQKGKQYFLIKWVGWKKPTWEPVENLDQVPDMIYEFKEERRKKQNSKNIFNSKKPPNKSKTQSGEEYYEAPLKKFKRKKAGARNSQDKLNESNGESIFHCQQESEDQEGAKASPLQKRVKRGTQISKADTIILDESFEENMAPQPTQKTNIYFHPVKRIKELKLVNEKWMFQVEFEQQNLPNAWIDRDIIRVLYPLKTLEFYELLVKATIFRDV